MEGLTDLFGEGASYSNGILSIPRANLEDVGLAPFSNDLISIVTALVLRIDNYFSGVLVDHDGAVLIDDNGDSLGYDQNREEPLLNSEYSGKELSIDELELYWNWLISFYDLKA
ncbi:MAG: hypothetical protein VKL41_21590 [Snowella sp.]|nr:hypothetical protein [Snowella sp.]